MPETPLNPLRLAAALSVVLALVFGAAAAASPAGPSGIRPLIEGEEPATLEKPADQGTPVGTAVSLPIKGKELLTLKAEGLPAGLTIAKTSTSEWEVTGTPTTIRAPAVVTLTAENPGHGSAAVSKFNWSVGGINPPPDLKKIALAPVKIIITGAEMKTLTSSPLPAGLELKDVGSSEAEWEIAGAATQTGLTQIELKGQNAKAQSLPPVEFTFGVVGANNPGPQTGTVGVPLNIPITGVEMAKITAAKPLPAGLKLEDSGAEFEWRILGTPTSAGTAEVELEVETPGKETELLTFTLAIAPAEVPPAPTPPSATGTLTITPAGAFSAARATCSGVTFSPATISTQWLLDGAPIAGATGTVYVAPRVDDGHQLSCRQTALSADGATAVVSSAAATVHEQPPSPTGRSARPHSAARVPSACRTANRPRPR